jgi:hypothetical protein
MAFNSAAESFEGRTESSQQFTTVLSAEALFTRGSNDLYKKALNASMNFSSIGDLPSCDDLLKQFGDTKTQPLYDKSEKGAKPVADETPTLKSWDEATKGKKPQDDSNHHKSDDASKHNKSNDAHNSDAHKTDRVLHPKSWAEIVKSANEVQHKIAEQARKEPDVVSVTESKKNGEKIETVTVEKKNGSKIVYNPNGETKHYPARPLPGNAALEDWLE